MEKRENQIITLKKPLRVPKLLGTAEYSENTNKLDNLTSDQFLRSDQADFKIGDLTIIDGAVIADRFNGVADQADHADEADTAINAQYAKTAEKAGEADHADEADTAVNAQYAKSAERAGEADLAQFAHKTGFSEYAENSKRLDKLMSHEYINIYDDNFLHRSIHVNKSLIYENLIELYFSDKQYPIYTIVSIGGDKDITAFDNSNHVIGVIGDKRDYNFDLRERVPVIVKGKTKCLIEGIAKKGQLIVAYKNGRGMAVNKVSQDQLLVGIVLEDSAKGIASIKII